MTQHEPGRCRGAATHHVLVRATDVGGEHLQDHAVFGGSPQRAQQFGERDGLDFDLTLAQIHDASVV